MEQYTISRSDGCTATGTKVDGKVNGTVTVTFPNGVIKLLGDYVYNVPVGLHQEWDEDGDLVTTSLYSNDGRLLEVDGKPIPNDEEQP